MSDEDTVRQSLRSTFESTFEDRVARALSVKHHGMVANHHFTWASMECIYLYRDGYFVATVLTTHAVAHGIIKFAAERNGLIETMKLTDLAIELHRRGFITEACSHAMTRILGTYRNDVSHMNPVVANVPIVNIAKQNLEDLAIIEGELWAFTSNNGKIVPTHRQYWDISKDGKIEVSLRFG